MGCILMGRLPLRRLRPLPKRLPVPRLRMLLLAMRLVLAPRRLRRALLDPRRTVR